MNIIRYNYFMKRYLSICFILFSTMFLSAQVLNDSQILKNNHWVYESLNKISKEQQVSYFIENSMLSIGEIKFYFEQINFEQLSESGKKTYRELENFLYSRTNLITSLNNLVDKNIMDDSAVQFNLNVIFNPELYYKSNPDIDWSFTYNYRDNFVTAPVSFGFANIIAVENNIFFGKSFMAASKSDNFTNLPYTLSGDYEFLFNKFAYGSIGYNFNKWGFNIHIGKQGYSVGNTKLNSIFYSDKFETDGYFLLDLYSKSLKYNLSISQVDFSKYLYIHQLEIILFDKIKLAVMEGSHVVAPLELRFINPFLFMHQMSAWHDYNNRDAKLPYEEEKFCAYFGWYFETNLIKNTRIYALYAQNEIQSQFERVGSGKFYPDSYALQIGVDTSIPSRFDGYWNINFEGVYTSPYMYIKHTPEASLYRVRTDNITSDSIKTWLGSPFGPDNISLYFDFGFNKLSKWTINFGYLMSMKGEIDFNTLDSKTDYNGDDFDKGSYYNYYPAVAYKLKSEPEDDLERKALNMFPSGIVQYTNRFMLNGEYTLNHFIKFDSQILYSVVVNTNHKKDQRDQGIELSFSMTYNIF